MALKIHSQYLDEQESKSGAILTILSHWLPEWRTRAQNNTDEDVLETGEQEQCGILRVGNVALFQVQLWWQKPA
jgi:hypothetical protein